jgi:hypothetical protein
MIKETKITEQKIKEMIAIADQASSIALEQLGTQNLSKNHEMLLTWKYFSAEGIRKSLELADLVEASEAL